MFGNFIDLNKVFDTMDRERCLMILKAHGVREKSLQLISQFWTEAMLTCRAGGSYGRMFIVCS